MPDRGISSHIESTTNAQDAGGLKVSRGRQLTPASMSTPATEHVRNEERSHEH